MLRCEPILLENHLKTPSRPVQSDTLRKAREPVLIRGERNRQFPIALFFRACRQEVVGPTICFCRIFMRWLFPCMDLVTTDEVVLALSLPQKQFASRISKFDCVNCTCGKAGKRLAKGILRR